MASTTLIEAVKGYDKYLMTDGTDRKSLRKRAFEEQTMNAYTMACRVAIEGEHDLEYGLKLTHRVKNMLNDFAIFFSGPESQVRAFFSGLMFSNTSPE